MADEGFPEAERFGTVLALVPFLIVMTPLVLLKVPLRVGGESTVLTDVILFGFALNNWWRDLYLTEYKNNFVTLAFSLLTEALLEPN